MPDNAYGDVHPSQAWRQQERDIRRDNREETQQRRHMEEWRQAQPERGQDSSESESSVAHDDTDVEELTLDAMVSLLMQAIHHEPSTYKEAMSRPDANEWELAMKDELKSHAENGTWILVNRPHGRKTVKSKWVYAIKSDGRYKARLVAKGFTQVQGIDY